MDNFCHVVTHRSLTPCAKFDEILSATFKVTVKKTLGLLFVDTVYIHVHCVHVHVHT